MVRELPNVVNCRKINKPTFGHLDFLWGRIGDFYDDLNKHLDDIHPSDLAELKQQIDYVNEKTTLHHPGDYAVFWYIKSMSANMRYSWNNVMDVIEKQLSNVNLY